MIEMSNGYEWIVSVNYLFQHLSTLKVLTSWFLLRFCAACTPLTDTQIVPVEEEEPEPTPFTSEPTNIEDLQAKYLVENKMPGRVPGSTLFLTTAVQRNGEKVEMVEGQSFKLWLVARLSNPLLDQQSFVGSTCTQHH